MLTGLLALGAALAQQFYRDRGIAHEMIHIDENQVSDRLAKYTAKQHRSPTDPSQWKWQEFGASYGAVKENHCDYDGAKLVVQGGYSPFAFGTMLQALSRSQRLTHRTPRRPRRLSLGSIRFTVRSQRSTGRNRPGRAQ